MKIDEIRKIMTREKFLNELEKNKFGFKGDYECPKDIGLLNLENKCIGESEKRCKKCWLEATKDVKFKGEETENEPEKYECIEDFKMYNGTIAFIKGRIYIANKPDINGDIYFIKDDCSTSLINGHYLTKEETKRHFKKIEEIQINKELWNEFLSGKVAVNCKNYCEAEKFMEYCEDNNLKWRGTEKEPTKGMVWENEGIKYLCDNNKLCYYLQNETCGEKEITYKELTTSAVKEECTLGEEKKEYSIQEVFGFPVGTEFTNGIAEFVIKKENEAKVLFLEKDNIACKLTDLWFNQKFALMKDYYMTFEEARKIGIPKHKEFENREVIKTTIDELINELDKKVWYVEEEE